MFKPVKLLVISLFVLSFSACNMVDELQSFQEISPGKKMWIFTQINVSQEDNKIEDYYYFGKINTSLYKKIKSGKINSGFIVLENVRYWASDDSIKSYSDELYSDEMVFRIENIRRIELVKQEPVPGFKYSDDITTTDQITDSKP